MKNVLITGASRGIGAAIAREMAKDARVFVNYNKSEAEAFKMCREINGVPVKCDVSNEAEVLKMTDKINNEYGGVDILINNAGISKIKMLRDTSVSDYDSIFNTNMKGIYLVTKAVIDNMVNKKSGKILNISSMWGVTGASCEAVYSASKAAVIGFTKAMAKELGPSNINVNCIAPGVIDTEMNKALSDEDKKAIAFETPLMRIGTAEEIAKAARFLVSDDASFITGQILCVDGGITI